jgi:hypothetical protein
MARVSLELPVEVAGTKTTILWFGRIDERFEAFQPLAIA